MNPDNNTQNGDLWKRWLLYRRNPADELGGQNNEGLKSIRDKVLENARIQQGETLLDVGTGTGLIAFGAMDKVGEEGTVIFSDISADCLDYCQSFAENAGIASGCRFVHAPIEDLSAIADSSADVVTSRSVLIYSYQKQQAFNEFHRVLKPGGRLSMFEPINQFGFAAGRSPHTLRGYNVEPIAPIVARLREVIDAHQPVEGSPMLEFDERDLLTYATTAGFSQVHLEYEAHIAPVRFGNWEYFYRSAPNPLALSLEEAAMQALSQEEQEQFIGYMRPKIENEQATNHFAFALLMAVKG
jgi:ubiquinone/menaquinone biosynthesis C-methylase UbiE